VERCLACEAEGVATPGPLPNRRSLSLCARFLFALAKSDPRAQQRKHRIARTRSLHVCASPITI